MERANILDPNTVYFDECLDFYQKHPGQTNKNKRLSLRVEWIKNAIEKVGDCNAIFVDPDNGLEIPSCPKLNQAKSGKYAYYSEISKLFYRRDVIVIYHHLNRHKNHGSHKQQMQGRAEILKKKIDPSGKLFAIRYKPYSPRAYFILCNKNSEKAIRESLNSFLGSAWKKHWDSYLEI